MTYRPGHGRTAGRTKGLRAVRRRFPAAPRRHSPPLDPGVVEMVDSGVLRSILGRPFPVKKENYKSVFSGMIQGSVAHAMHNSLIKVYREFPSNILVETHDSITMICDKTIAKDVINKVSAIMLRPFSGIINSNPLFPVKVYVGESWKNWKFLRVYR